jgi:hypothetical protein
MAEVLGKVHTHGRSSRVMMASSSDQMAAPAPEIMDGFLHCVSYTESGGRSVGVSSLADSDHGVFQLHRMIHNVPFRLASHFITSIIPSTQPYK